MMVTEVRIIPVSDSANPHLRAFASLTLDNAVVVRDLRILDGQNGLFVAMPCRKITYHCPGCTSKNHLRARYCNHCGKSLEVPAERVPVDPQTGRIKFFGDVVHPISVSARAVIDAAVLTAYRDQIASVRKEISA